MKIFILTLLAFITIWAYSGCHTVHGAGQDVKHAGQKIENASGI